MHIGCVLKNQVENSCCLQPEIYGMNIITRFHFSEYVWKHSICFFEFLFVEISYRLNNYNSCYNCSLWYREVPHFYLLFKPLVNKFGGILG